MKNRIVCVRSFTSSPIRLHSFNVSSLLGKSYRDLYFALTLFSLLVMHHYFGRSIKVIFYHCSFSGQVKLMGSCHCISFIESSPVSLLEHTFP